MKPLLNFPYQFVGDATLVDGSNAVFCSQRNSFRDSDAKGPCSHGGAHSGIEAVPLGLVASRDSEAKWSTV